MDMCPLQPYGILMDDTQSVRCERTEMRRIVNSELKNDYCIRTVSHFRKIENKFHFTTSATLTPKTVAENLSWCKVTGFMGPP